VATNPFTYGKPIANPARFIGRQREIEQVHSRLLNAEFESSSIAGERRIGKTSLLKYLSHPDVGHNAGFPADEYIFVYVDLQILDCKKTPTDFWRRVLRSTKQHIKDEEILEAIDHVRQSQYIDTLILDDLFSLVDDANLHIALLLDEFEMVTQNQAFDVDYFCGLRSLATQHHLALITSSRRELVELTHSKEVRHSPFFNILTNIILRPFSENEAKNLIETYLAGNRVSFQRRDVDYILEIAGPHPYFLQMVCSSLYDAYRHGNDAQLRRHFVDVEFREKAAPMFSDYWHRSARDQRVLLTIMSLRTLERGGGSDTIEQLKAFYGGAEHAMLDLEKRGLVLAEKAEPARYRPFSLAFCNWITAELAARAGDEAVWTEWQVVQADRLDKLSPEARQRLLGLLPHLNSVYADSIGDWLLNPFTFNRAAPLLENLLGTYWQYLDKEELMLVEAFAIPVLTRAVDFLFNEAKNILEERRAARQTPDLKMAAPPDIPLLEQDKEAVLKHKVSEEMAKAKERAVQSILEEIEIYQGNYYHLQKQVALGGGLDYADPGLANKLHAQEDNILEASRQLAAIIGELIR
jgi:hypothetical protein